MKKLKIITTATLLLWIICLPHVQFHFDYKINLHTYIIGHYNPSARIIDLVSNTTYVVCVNFIHKWRDLHFKVDSERQIFLRNFSWHLITHRVFARNLLRGNRRRNTFRILFWCLAWGSNPDFSSNKPIHYLLDHGDFIYCNM